MTEARAATATKATDANYGGPAGRDRRIDMLRGAAIVLFAIAVIAAVSKPDARAFDSTATVSALALIITLEGALIGMLYRPRAATGLGESALRLWRRARAWYASSLALVVAGILLGLIPAIDTASVTRLDAGTRPFLFGAPPINEAGLAIGYPLDPDVLLDVLLLRVGPWPLDVAVLAIALFTIAPLALLLLARGRWASLLAVSVVIYVIELVTTVRLLPTRAEANLPILGWQLVFILGMIAGHYRRELVRWFRRGLGLAIFLVLALAAVVWFAFPAVLSLRGRGLGFDLLAAVAGPQTGWLFEPSAPGPLRVALTLVIVVVAYGALTVAWRPLSLVLGWLLAPMGSAVMPALVLLVCASVSTSSFAAANAVYLPVPVIVAIIVAVMWLVALVWARVRSEKVAQ